MPDLPDISTCHYRYGGIRLMKFGKKSNMAAKVTADKVGIATARVRARFYSNLIESFSIFFHFSVLQLFRIYRHLLLFCTPYANTLPPASKSCRNCASARLENVQLKS